MLGLAGKGQAPEAQHTCWKAKPQWPLGLPAAGCGQCIALAPQAEALGTADSRWVSLSIQWETKAGRPLVGGAWANLGGASRHLNSRLDDWTSRPSSAVHVHSPPTRLPARLQKLFLFPGHPSSRWRFDASLEVQASLVFIFKAFFPGTTSNGALLRCHQGNQGIYLDFCKL